MITLELFVDESLHIVDVKSGTIATMTYATIESKKQAELFASAPELLNALQLCRTWYDLHGKDYEIGLPNCFIQAKAAIKKVKGEQSVSTPIITVTKTHEIDIDNIGLNCNIVVGNEVFDISLQYNIKTNLVHNNLDDAFTDKLEASGIDISDICIKIENRKIQIQ